MWNACPHEPTESTATMTSLDSSSSGDGSLSSAKQIAHSAREVLKFGGCAPAPPASAALRDRSHVGSTASVGAVVHGRHTSPTRSPDSEG